MAKITEAMVRQNTEDIIYIGQVAERLYNSESGHFLRAVIQGKITNESRRYKTDLKTPADRCLGRIEGYNDIIDSIELAIQEGKELNRPKTEEEIEQERNSTPQEE